MAETVKANARNAKVSAQKATSNPAQLYLLAYNVASALAWGFILYSVIEHMTSSSSSFSIIPSKFQSYTKTFTSRASTLYSGIGFWVKWIQTAAMLEPIHVQMGLVRSALPTTAMQVFSRLTLVWGILEMFPATQSSPAYATMVFAWSVTEVIRYSTYAFNILNVKLQFLDWLRYNLFYVLYPLGAGSEWYLMYSALPYARAKFHHLGFYTLIGFCGLWPLALMFLMLHMHGQRGKHFGSGGGGKIKKGKKRA